MRFSLTMLDNARMHLKGAAEPTPRLSQDDLIHELTTTSSTKLPSC